MDDFFQGFEKQNKRNQDIDCMFPDSVKCGKTREMKAIQAQDYSKEA